MPAKVASRILLNFLNNKLLIFKDAKGHIGPMLSTKNRNSTKIAPLHIELQMYQYILNWLIYWCIHSLIRQYA